MSKKEELSKKLESLKHQLNEVLSEINEVETEQKELNKEEKLVFEAEVKKIVDRMNEYFNSDDRSINMKVRAFEDQQKILILQPDKRVVFVRFYYGDSSLEEIEAWADSQITSLQFYRILASIELNIINDPIFGERFSIKASDEVNIYPTYDRRSGLVTLEIKSFLSIKSIEKMMNDLNHSKITFNSISSGFKEDDYIVESIESYTCYLNEMMEEIHAIRKEYNR